jgi:DNA-binding LytR/AlgR family response regulator
MAAFHRSWAEWQDYGTNSGETVKHMHMIWWWWAAAAAALVLVLMFWCQLHGSALGQGLVGLGVSLPWAVKSAFGWVLAGLLLVHGGERLLATGWSLRHPVAARVALGASLPFITMGNELALLAGDNPVALWLYERLPLHLTFGALLFAGYLWLRARHATPAAEPAAVPAVPAAAGSPSPMVEVMTGTGRTHVALADIECLEADRNYINVHTPERSYLLRQTLASLEKSLRPEVFLRVHRSTIVNRCKIRERRRGGVLVLVSGRTVRVSRAFADRLN